MLPIINIGPLAVQTPGLILILGIWFSLLILEKFSRKFDMDADFLSSLMLWFLFSFVIFARIGYIAQYPTIFLDHPLSILSPNLGLFDIPSGLIFASIIFFILIKRKQTDLLRVLNALTPGIALFLLCYFISLFASGKYYGFASKLPWAIFLWGTTRHPLQLYYVGGLILLGSILYCQLIKNKNIQFLFLKFIRNFSILVIFLDYFRGDVEHFKSSIHILQIVAFLALLISLYYLQLKPIRISPNSG